jgi:S-DNA-T family DNA segregation ATPase FtsK/SpoIIIE
MSGTSKPHGANNSRSTESEIDETVTMIVVALTKGLAVLLWWSVLFPMIGIPTLASVWIGFRYGPMFGLVLAAVSGLALAAWSEISPASFQQWVTPADPDPVADLVGLPAPLDRDLHPARPVGEAG